MSFDSEITHPDSGSGTILLYLGALRQPFRQVRPGDRFPNSLARWVGLLILLFGLK